MRGRPVADGVAWPIPSISGAHMHYAYNSTAHAYSQEPMRAEGLKERPTAVLSVQLSARYVQIRQTAKIRNATP